MKDRLYALDSFRGIAAMLVFFYHLKEHLNSRLINNKFIENCYLFVDFFFILSGFVIAYSYNQRINDFSSLKRFIKRRFYRIYPLHLFMLIVFLIYFVFRVCFHFDFKNADIALHSKITFISNLFLVNSVKWSDEIKGLSWNIPSWSISAEFISYTIFGSCCFLFRNKVIRSIIAGFILIASFILLYRIEKSQSFHYTYDYGFLRGILGFKLGYFTFLFYLLVRTIRINFFTYSILESLCLLCIIFFVTNALHLVDNYGSIVYLIFSLTVLIFSFEGGIFSKMLSSVRLFKFLGEISYSLYLNHFFLIIIFSILSKRFFLLHETNQLINLAVLILLIMLLISVSKFTYNHIETRFKDGFGKMQRFNKKRFVREPSVVVEQKSKATLS